MKKVVIFAFALVVSVSAFAQTWTLDNAHSSVSFTITHLSISDVEGSFKTFSSKLTSSKDDFSDAVVEFTADVNSINTDNEDRDKHLKAPDYFDAEKYDKITFKSKSLKKVGDKKYKLTGDLTMHGVTKTVTLDVTFRGTATHPYTKKLVAGFKITGVIKRKDFGISPSTPDAVLSDEVNLAVNTEFTKD